MCLTGQRKEENLLHISSETEMDTMSYLCCLNIENILRLHELTVVALGGLEDYPRTAAISEGGIYVSPAFHVP